MPNYVKDVAKYDWLQQRTDRERFNSLLIEELSSEEVPFL